MSGNDKNFNNDEAQKHTKHISITYIKIVKTNPFTDISRFTWFSQRSQK